MENKNKKDERTPDSRTSGGRNRDAMSRTPRDQDATSRTPRDRPEVTIPEPLGTITPKRLPFIDTVKLNWPHLHSMECKHQCRNEHDHYERWRDAYYSHLLDLYVCFVEAVSSGNFDKGQHLNSSKANFNLFTEFVYHHSSGYISEFA
jgi:hypothetical protein